MRYGYGFGRGRRRSRVAQAYSPLSEFATATGGYFVEFADFTRMFQDIAGTTPVTAAGQAVGRMLDKSGNAYIFTPSLDARRPILRTESGCWGIEFEGTDDCLLTTVAVNPGATDKCQIVMGIRKDIAAARMVLETGANAAAILGSHYLVAGTDSGALGAGIDGYTAFSRYGTGAATATAQIAQAAPDTCVLAITHDIAGDLSTIRRNGVAGTSGTADKGVGNFESHVHYLGARSDASLAFDGTVWGGLFVRYGPNLAAGNISQLETWFAARTPGVTL